MDSNWADYWAEARKMGLSAFLAKRGTMLGLIIFGFIEVAPRVFVMVDNSELPIASFVICMLLGFAIARVLWWANERSYTKIAAARDAESPKNTTSQSAKQVQNDD